MAVNEKLIVILDREFRALEERGEGPFPTLQAMATRIGLDKTSLFRLRNGDRNLTRRKAIDIASKLRPDQSTALELADELIGARTVPAEHEVNVLEWFNKRKRQGCLLLVEFRELPAVRPGGTKPHLAEAVAAAVGGGQNYGMFFPFNLSKTTGADMPTSLLAYLLDLQSHVVDTYLSIRDHVLEQIYHEHRDSSVEVLTASLVSAISRLKLYFLAEAESSRFPAVGYRLFYVVEDDSNPQAQRWEWVSLHDQDQMILKHSTDEELKATAVRFFPIIDFWLDNGTLPQTRNDIIDFAQKLNRRRHAAKSLGVAESQWTVFGEDETAEAIVQEFLKAKEENTQ